MIWMDSFTQGDERGAQSTGRRILLVEDDYLVALNIKFMLERNNCQVIGPIPSIEKALQAIENEDVDAAILDINISGGTSAPIAEVLRLRNRPFVFVTGYQSPSHLLPEILRGVERLRKPVDERVLQQVLRTMLS